MTSAVLLVGLLDERATGLAAAVMLLVFFTVAFAVQGIAHLFGEPEGQGA
jgi:hypothetical protein